MSRTTGFILGFFLMLVGVIGCGCHVYKTIVFSQNCKGYLKQAADANTVELALERLDKAIAYAEKEELTTGYTSILWRTEDDNVEFWYNNLLACRQELLEGSDGTQLEKTNLLLKIRESLTDENADGTCVTIPNGIARYPSNLFWAIVITLSFLIFCAGFLLFIMACDNAL